MKLLLSAVLGVHSPSRARIYGVLLADPRRDWSVRDLAAELPDVSVEAVRTTLYLMLHNKLLDTVPQQRRLTMQLTTQGREAISKITASWLAPDHLPQDRPVSGVRAAVSADALRGPDEARQVIDDHLHSDAVGRCLGCGELEPCSNRNTAHVVLFAHNRQLPRRRPMASIRAGGGFSTGDATVFTAFGPTT